VLQWFAWIAACALTPFVMGTTVQALIIFNNPDYIFKRWHTVLLIWACVIFPVILNVRTLLLPVIRLPNTVAQVYARRLLASLEIVGGVCHFVFFFCNVITLGVLAQRSSNHFVWATLVNNVSGWTNPGAAFCIGLLSPTFVLSGFDGVLHMSTWYHMN
jgi:choline transport protein